MNELNLGQIPFPAHKRERRDSYTETQVQSAVDRATGKAASAAIATVEIVARLWESAFSTGESSVLRPWMLGRIGRELALRGQSLWWKSAASGLLPISDHDVRGASAAAERWRYRITLPGPSSSVSRTVAASDVLHVRVGAPSQRPWAGCSPLAWSEATLAVLREVDRSLAEEHSGPVGSVIPVSDPAGSQEIANQIGVLSGKAILTEASEMDLPGEGPGGRNLWRPNRVGPSPAQGTATARDSVERSILSAAGIPPSLVFGGSDYRDAWRSFLAGTVQPAAALVSDELKRIGLDETISFRGLNQSDIQARARAYKQLVDGKMDAADARRICGFD